MGCVVFIVRPTSSLMPNFSKGKNVERRSRLGRTTLDGRLRGGHMFPKGKVEDKYNLLDIPLGSVEGRLRRNIFC